MMKKTGFLYSVSQRAVCKSLCSCPPANQHLWSIDDGKGAVSTTARHLIYGPGSDVKPEGWMAMWMSPAFVAVMLVVYLGGKVVLEKLCKTVGTTGKSLPFKAFVLAHNLLLCVFSASIAYKNWTIAAYTCFICRNITNW